MKGGVSMEVWAMALLGLAALFAPRTVLTVLGVYFVAEWGLGATIGLSIVAFLFDVSSDKETIS